MLTKHLYKYIETIIKEQEDYSLSVLYYCIRDTFEKNNFSLKGIQTIEINNKFHEEAVSVNIFHNYSSTKESIALLLSLRAIILDRNLFQFCKDESLFFKSDFLTSFEWVKYASVILKNQADRDFNSLFRILEELEEKNKISEQSKKEFRRNTIVPPFKNLRNYYKEIAENELQNTSSVIVNNAYLGNQTIEDLKIPQTIKYIGNTAIAYCTSLTQITIQSHKILFGIFSIIECDKLQRIIVPEGSEEYYKSQLPYYKDIIFTVNNKLDKIAPMQDVSESDYKKLKTYLIHGTTSYLYFWFLSIINIVKEKHQLSISYKEIISKMISLAWPMVNDNINFGTVDKLYSVIHDLMNISGLKSSSPSSMVEKYISKTYNDIFIHKILIQLTKTVPFEFLSPWIKNATLEEIEQFSQKNDSNTPYAIYDDLIVLDEAWYDLFNNNFDEINSFAKGELVRYLKSYNSDFILLKYMV